MYEKSINLVYCLFLALPVVFDDLEGVCFVPDWDLDALEPLFSCFPELRLATQSEPLLPDFPSELLLNFLSELPLDFFAELPPPVFFSELQLALGTSPCRSLMQRSMISFCRRRGDANMLDGRATKFRASKPVSLNNAGRRARKPNGQ